MDGYSIFVFLAALHSTAGTNGDSFKAYITKQFGTLGTDYMIRKGVPYLQCEEWEPSTAANETVVYEQCKQQGRMYQTDLGCNAIFKVKNMSIPREDNAILRPDEYVRVSGGCWDRLPDIHQCVDKHECIAVVNREKPQKGLAFCCCSTHRCNSKVTVRFGIPPDPGHEPVQHLSPLWICLGLALLLILFGIVIFCIVIRTKTGRRLMKKAVDLHKADAAPLVVESGKRRNSLNDRLARVGVIDVGAMGIVRRAMYKDPETGKERQVAVKTVHDEKRFLAEERVYRLCANRHAHVVHSLGTVSDDNVFEIVLEYQERGSLEKYLQEHTFSPMEALSLLASFMDGLAFLHIRSTSATGLLKNTIVHRNLKSSSVLVKADGTAAIGSFGVAMVCEGNRPGRQYQVGTDRYMSPELLVGLANLNTDGLKSADIYAAALIFWEVLNRTEIDEDDKVQPAELPYDAEVEQAVLADEAAFALLNGPTVLYAKKPMQYYLKDIVHRDNKRPVMRNMLMEHPITTELVKTTVDLWNWEVEGRISAACAHSRLHLLLHDLARAEDVIDKKYNDIILG